MEPLGEPPLCLLRVGPHGETKRGSVPQPGESRVQDRLRVSCDRISLSDWKQPCSYSERRLSQIRVLFRSVFCHPKAVPSLERTHERNAPGDIGPSGRQKSSKYAGKIYICPSMHNVSEIPKICSMHKNMQCIENTALLISTQFDTIFIQEDIRIRKVWLCIYVAERADEFRR